MKILFTKDMEWLEKWDVYLASNPRGSHLILSDWLKTYNSYGFDYELGIFIEDDIIIGGFGVVIPKILFFKFYIIPHGPIVNKGCETHLDFISEEINLRAKDLNCCYAQLSLPVSKNSKIKDHVFHPSEIKVFDQKWTNGKLFDYVYSSYGLNWMDFTDTADPETYLQTLASKVRQYVRLPYKKDTKIITVTDEEELKKGYHIFQLNANEFGYKIREFKDVKRSILELVNSDKAFFINIYVDDTVKASGFFIIAGNYITNVMAGAIKEKPDLKLGYMLQWEAVKKSIDLGFVGYNISVGGTDGVKAFKQKFGANATYYEEPNYHKVIKPQIFKVYLSLEKYIKPYKSIVSNYLSKFK